MEKLYKYPRTPHFGFSQGKDDDDIVSEIIPFIGKEVVVSEKCDGECTTVTSKKFFARSLDSKMHISRSWIAQLHATIKNNIPTGWRICGENMFATHSLHYRKLPTYFLVFGIYDENNMCLSWDDTEYFCKDLGLITVPVLYRGIWDEEIVKKCYTGKSKYDAIDIITKKEDQEGYVVRSAESFHYNDFQNNTIKMVRQGHVKTNDHWTKSAIIKNELEKS